MNKFYTYHLIDSSNNIPFYVGKGCGDRMYSHELDVKKGKIPHNNRHLFNKINKLLRNSIPITYKKVLDCVGETSSSLTEISEIKKIGRKDLGLGPLCNLTDGGEGHMNLSKEINDKKRKKLRYKKSQSHRLKLSLAHMGKFVSTETREKLKHRKFQAWSHKENPHHTKETKKVMSFLKKGKSWEEIYGIEDANRRRENLKNRHSLGLMKSDYNVLCEARKKDWINRKLKETTNE